MQEGGSGPKKSQSTLSQLDTRHSRLCTFIYSHTVPQLFNYGFHSFGNKSRPWSLWQLWKVAICLLVSEAGRLLSQKVWKPILKKWQILSYCGDCGWLGTNWWWLLRNSPPGYTHTHTCIFWHVPSQQDYDTIKKHMANTHTSHILDQ